MAPSQFSRTRIRVLSTILFLSCVTWVQVLPAAEFTLFHAPTLDTNIPKIATRATFTPQLNLTPLQSFQLLQSREVVQESALKSAQTTVDRLTTDRITNTITINTLTRLPTVLPREITPLPTGNLPILEPTRTTLSSPPTLTGSLRTAPVTAAIIPLPAPQLTKVLNIPNVNRQFTAFRNTGLPPAEIMETTQRQVRNATDLSVQEIAHLFSSQRTR